MFNLFYSPTRFNLIQINYELISCTFRNARILRGNNSGRISGGWSCDCCWRCNRSGGGRNIDVCRIRLGEHNGESLRETHRHNGICNIRGEFHFGESKENSKDMSWSNRGNMWWEDCLRRVDEIDFQARIAVEASRLIEFRTDVSALCNFHEAFASKHAQRVQRERIDSRVFNLRGQYDFAQGKVLVA